MIEKYTHPSEYFPACDHGSSLLAAMSSGGLSLVMFGCIRFSRDRWSMVEALSARRLLGWKGMISDCDGCD